MSKNAHILSRGPQRPEATVAEARPEEAQLLRINPGEGVLVMERITYTRGDRPLEFVRAVYRPEHYTFSVRLKR